MTEDPFVPTGQPSIGSRKGEHQEPNPIFLIISVKSHHLYINQVLDWVIKPEKKEVTKNERSNNLTVTS